MRDHLELWAAMALSYAVAAVTGAWCGARDAVRAVRRDWRKSARPVYELCPDCDRFPYSRCPTCGA